MDGILSGMGLFGDKSDKKTNSHTQPSTHRNQPKAPATPPDAKAVNHSSSAGEELHIDTHIQTSSSVQHTTERSASMKNSSISPFSGSTPPTPEVSISEEHSPSAVIGSKITFKGELSGDEDLLIQGTVEGTVTLKGNNLTVGRLGKVKANLSAKSIIVDGTVEGDLVAEEHIAINASSIVTGNIKTNRMTLEDGAKFRGSIDMDVEPTQATKATAAKPSSDTEPKKAAEPS